MYRSEEWESYLQLVLGIESLNLQGTGTLRTLGITVLHRNLGKVMYCRMLMYHARKSSIRLDEVGKKITSTLGCLNFNPNKGNLHGI